jgi:hypothetical protein
MLAAARDGRRRSARRHSLEETRKEGSPETTNRRPMVQDLDQAIRERAYQLWIESGRDDGKADAHWLAAQREILSVSLGDLDWPTSSKAKKIEKPKKAKAPRKRRAA